MINTIFRNYQIVCASFRNKANLLRENGGIDKRQFLLPFNYQKKHADNRSMATIISE
jgi:hypothetical protein